MPVAHEIPAARAWPIRPLARGRLAAVTRFELALNDAVVRFVDQMTELAVRSARDTAVHALERTKSSSKPKQRRRAPEKSVSMPDVSRLGLARALDALQREWIVRALEQHQGSISKAARALRTNRQGLQRRIQRLRIPTARQP